MTILFCIITFGATATAQNSDTWPKTLETPDGTLIKVYQPEAETLKGMTLSLRAALSVQEKGAADPAFGTFWADATITTDRDNREIILNFVKVSGIRIPKDSAADRLNYFKSAIEAAFPEAVGAIPLDEIVTSLNQQMDQTRLSNSFNTQAPVILYTNHPTVLVTIDGTPRFEENRKWGLDAMVNTPFTIVKDKDGHYYCWGDGQWYSAAEATGPYSPLTSEPDRRLRKIEKEYEKSEPDSLKKQVDSVIPTIVVTTTPAELLQTKGTPNLQPIAGTNLLYVSNSPDNIFLDTQSQLYYVLLSGRWYRSNALEGGNGWAFVAADQLPADFANIPEGSPKDNVLASVAGTRAAQEAVMDAQIPQTAKIDRKNASLKIEYDGVPQFQAIAGTHLQYAVNTSTTIVYDTHQYFALDNGVWFVSDNPTGPWNVSTVRPSELDAIPPGSPVYNAKYVDIYESTPDYVYVGYTPGYLNNFIYGATVVYGTGFYYAPWIGRHYYPRPWSWGFNMIYNPWYGWGFGFGYNVGWFNFGLDWDGWYGGWWGPDAYYPFAWGIGLGFGFGFQPHGFYGGGAWVPNHGHFYAHSNIYHGRSGIAEHRAFAGSRPGFDLRPGGEHPAFTDRRGNVFQRDREGQWQNRTGHEDVRPMVNGLEQQRAAQERGAIRASGFQQARSFSAPHFSGFRGGLGHAGGFHGGSRR